MFIAKFSVPENEALETEIFYAFLGVSKSKTLEIELSWALAY